MVEYCTVTAARFKPLGVAHSLNRVTYEKRLPLPAYRESDVSLEEGTHRNIPDSQKVEAFRHIRKVKLGDSPKSFRELTGFPLASDGNGRKFFFKKNN